MCIFAHLNMERFISDILPFQARKDQAELIEFVENYNSNKPIVICKSRQVGVSTILAALVCYWALSRENTKVLILSPNLSIADGQSRIVTDIILNAPKGTRKKRNGICKSIIEQEIDWAPNSNTKLFKKFNNGSFIRHESICKDASRIRGISADVIIFDEAQVMKEYAVDIVKKMQSNSKNPITIYSTTPIVAKNYTDWTKKLWDNSDKRVFNYSCTVCDKNFTINDKNIKLVNGENITCPYCDFEQLQSRAMCNGKWVAEKPEAEITGFRLTSLKVTSNTGSSYLPPYGERFGCWDD